MDLNEIVVKEIIDSHKERLKLDFDFQLQEKIREKEKYLKKEEKIKVAKLLEEINEKNQAIEKSLEVEIENERLKRENNLAEKQKELEFEKLKNQMKSELTTQLEKSISEKYEIQLAEKEIQISQVKKSAKEAVSRASQSPSQIQGESQEEAIEKWLINNFPLDKIHEVKKGSLGADCLQVINGPGMENCGNIYYESKNTKEFNNQWISKFKTDIQNQNADIGVLVTKTPARGQKRMKVIDGIYVCSFEEFKGLSEVLRNTIIEFSKHKRMNENIKDKKELLYTFLTSKNFINSIERIIESFVNMNRDLSKEERISAKNFSKRRSLMKIAQDNTISLFTNFSSIAGASIQNLDLLEYETGATMSNVEILKRISNEDEDIH